MQLLLAAIKEISIDVSVAAILFSHWRSKKKKKYSTEWFSQWKRCFSFKPKRLWQEFSLASCVLQLATGWWHTFNGTPSKLIFSGVFLHITMDIWWTEQHAIGIYLHGFVSKGSNRLHFLPLYKDGAKVWPPFDTFLSQSLGRWVWLSITAYIPML